MFFSDFVLDQFGLKKIADTKVRQIWKYCKELEKEFKHFPLQHGYRQGPVLIDTDGDGIIDALGECATAAFPRCRLRCFLCQPFGDECCCDTAVYHLSPLFTAFHHYAAVTGYDIDGDGNVDAIDLDMDG